MDDVGPRRFRQTESFYDPKQPPHPHPPTLGTVASTTTATTANAATYRSQTSTLLAKNKDPLFHSCFFPPERRRISEVSGQQMFMVWLRNFWEGGHVEGSRIWGYY